ncbi:hypothetical protein B0T25DRAFT_598258 [Lasiosphaeria hispida]|uniref:Uncharacterized protein n=1 Tax=Lasiosphaeria hispida TaxID=260671 RepID=A0AAJ0ML10_9PEZI|nr:hypothetical protein B0T25DRAFT_598258 [Lasiosphaeria hispida]
MSCTWFPVITTCLALGAALDPRPESHYNHWVLPLSTQTEFDQVDNDDGLTVIDISNLDAIRYCFFFLDRVMTPLTCVEYYRKYYKKDDPSLPQPADLGAWELVSSETLRNLWPHGNWRRKEAEVLDDDTIARENSIMEGSIKSLRSLAFERAIKHMADEPEQQAEHLAAVEHIPRFHSELWNFLGQNPDLVRRRGGSQLLGFALRDTDTNTLDFSPYPWLTETQILELIEKNSLAVKHSFTALDLSHTATVVDTSSIRRILDACPTVTELSVLCVDNLPLLPLLRSLEGSNVTKVLHSDLFRYPISRANAVAISGYFSSATRKSKHAVIRQAIVINFPIDRKQTTRNFVFHHHPQHTPAITSWSGNRAPVPPRPRPVDDNTWWVPSEDPNAEIGPARPPNPRSTFFDNGNPSAYATHSNLLDLCADSANIINRALARNLY